MPVWAVEHLPTLDGPAHVYNAWVLLQHGNDEEYPLFRRYYEIDGRPLPNWLGHAVLALLMSFVEPPAAEKILVSGYVVLFLAAAMYAAGAVDPERSWLGLLAFPFVFHQPFLLGFYNFSYSLAFWLLALGFWWRRRASPDAGLAVGINLLLLLCWFSHIVSLVLALFSLGVLWLATLRRAAWKRHLLHVAILAPQAVLPLWFIAAEGSGAGGQARSLSLRAASLLRLDALAHFGGPRRWIAPALAAVFLLLIVLTLGRERLRGTGGRTRLALGEADGFLLLSLALAGVFLFSPTEMSGGSILLPRLSLYPWLALLPWLSPRLPGRARAALAGGLAALTLAQAGCVLHVYRRLDARTREFLAGTQAIPPDCRVLPLVFDRGMSQVYWHLFGYAALEKGLLDWTNYEAGTTLFPVRFRPAGSAQGRLLARMEPGRVDLGAVREVDAVYTWKMPPGSRQALELERGWRLVSVRGDARVYLRNSPPSGARSGISRGLAR